MTDETKSKKPKYFPCKTKRNANSYSKKNVKVSFKIELKWVNKKLMNRRGKNGNYVKRLSSICTEQEPENQSLIILSLN